MKKLHYIQHVPFESPGSIVDWAQKESVQISSTKLYKDELFPNTNAFDYLVVMGGPMGVNDEKTFPWLREEKIFIEKTIRTGKVVLGICLGAQLVAQVLGGDVTTNKYKEIGWYSIHTTRENKSLRATGFLPDNFTAFHWHGDTFALPAGAVKIAYSEGCENQGFVYDDKVIALQFHLEVTEELLGEMVKNGRSELVADRSVQDEAEILANREFMKSNNDHMSKILTNVGKIS